MLAQDSSCPTTSAWMWSRTSCRCPGAPSSCVDHMMCGLARRAAAARRARARRGRRGVARRPGLPGVDHLAGAGCPAGGLHPLGTAARLSSRSSSGPPRLPRCSPSSSTRHPGAPADPGDRAVHRSVDPASLRRCPARGRRRTTVDAMTTATSRHRPRHPRARTAQAYGDRVAVDGIDLDVAAARSSPCSGRTAPARPPPSRSSRATARRRAATCGCSARTRPRRRRLAGPDRHRAAGRGRRRPSSPSPRWCGTSPATTRDPATADEVIEPVGLTDKRDTARPRKLSGGQRRRARRRARHRRPARAALPRRADHRVRPGGPPPVLGADRRLRRRRHDDPAHHPLPRRGRGARRPGRR